jgi:hypothetical protein
VYLLVQRQLAVALERLVRPIAGASARASNVTRIVVILPCSTRIQLAVG